MCSICMVHPCHPRCPNAKETDPVPKYRCKECGAGIQEGKRYFNNGEYQVCEACLNDMSVEEILDLVEEKLSIA